MLVYEELLRALHDAGVRSVIVGGVAVVLHGVVRATIDIDLAIGLDADNVTKTVRVLTTSGYVPRVPVDALLLADPEVRAGWQREKGMLAFSFLHPKRPLEIVDLMIGPGVPFEDLVVSSVARSYGSVEVRVCSVEHLMTMKRGAGRAKDLADLEELERLAEGDLDA